MRPAFVSPSLPLSPSHAQLLVCRRRLSARSRLRTPRAQCPSRPPDYASFTPDNDVDYQEVRVLSFGPSRNDGSLLTLRPVSGGPHAFKMSVTTTQADSIRTALRVDNAWPHMLHRPGTHDLFKSLLDLTCAFVTKAAITHIQDDVFIARIWFHSDQGDLDVDARPSDAIAMATRCRAPLYLNAHLLNQWHVSVDTVERDAKHGLCERVQYSDAVKSSRSIREEIRAKPEHLKLSKLKMELDLAVRLERFSEALMIKEQISHICPLDTLEEDLKLAIQEQRFLDAARIQDAITVWRARLRMWEKGTIDLEQFEEKEDLQ